MGWGGKRGDVAVQGEEWVPERGWGAGRPPQGRTKTRGHLGCGWGRGTRCLRHCTPRGQPFPSSVTPPREQSWDGVPFPGDSGCAVPPVQPHGNGQPALEGAPRPPRQPPRGGDTEMCRGPPGQGPPWGIVTWGQGNGANQGLSPKQNCPSRPGAGGGGAAAIAILSPSTERACHGSGLTPGCPHAGDHGDTSVPLLGHRQSSAVTNPSPEPPVKDNRGAGTRMPARRSQHVRERWSRAGANLPPCRHPRTPPAPSCRAQHPSKTPRHPVRRTLGSLHQGRLGQLYAPPQGTSTHHVWGN